MDEEDEGEVYQQAMQRMLAQLRERMLEDRMITMKEAAKDEEEDRRVQEHRKHKTEMRVRYQRELLEQIKSDKERREVNVSEHQKPGISEDYHGYPNLPQTPRDVRRRRELEKQAEFSKSVSEQLAANQRLRREATENEMKFVKEIIDQDLRDREKELHEEQARKKALKAKLQKAWLQADRAKRLMKEIEQSIPPAPPSDPPQKPSLQAPILPTLPNPIDTPKHIPTTREDDKKEETKGEEGLKKKKEALAVKLTEKLSETQIQSLAQYLSVTSPKLPMIREYAANDMPVRSPSRKAQPLLRVSFRQNSSQTCAHRHRSEQDKAAVQDRLTRLNVRIRRGQRPPSSPLKVRTHSLSLYQRSPVKLGQEPVKAVNRTYITEEAMY